MRSKSVRGMCRPLHVSNTGCRLAPSHHNHPRGRNRKALLRPEKGAVLRRAKGIAFRQPYPARQPITGCALGGAVQYFLGVSKSTKQDVGLLPRGREADAALIKRLVVVVERSSSRPMRASS